jgi:hypothetical protein
LAGEINRPLEAFAAEAGFIEQADGALDLRGGDDDVKKTGTDYEKVNLFVIVGT